MFGVAAIMMIVVTFTLPMRADPETLAPDEAAPIQLTADWSQEWSDETGHTALFRGHAKIVQGANEYAADKLVVWVRRVEQQGPPRDELTIYLEDHVSIRTAAGDRSTPSHLVQLTTTQGITLTVRGRKTDVPATDDALFQRGLQRRFGQKRSDLQQTQYVVDPLQPGVQAIPIQQTGAAIRRVRIFQRGANPPSLQMQPVPNTDPPEQIVFITGGLQLIVDAALDDVGTVDLAADRAVIWTSALSSQNPLESVQSRDTPYEVYLEGNIVIRQGNQVIRAERAYYDAREERALVENAELKAFLPDIDGSVRVRAERLRQINRSAYHAQNAWFTSSEYGRPGYRLQASDVFIEERPDFGVPPLVDPVTGRVSQATTPWATVNNATLLFGEVPVFYSPQLTVPAEDPGIPLQTLTFRQDRVFGTQLRTRWDAHQLFGLDRPPNTRWSLELDYLSQRGPLVGTDGKYRGFDGDGRPFFGEGLGMYIHDDGTDNLGFDRRSLDPSDPNRGRLMHRHRHWLTDELTLQTEIGYVSDRNLLEQYYEQEFDMGKDQETGALLRWARENTALSLFARGDINRFENDTQWLPRGDAYVLNEPLLDGNLYWSTHTSAAYATLEPAAAPTNPLDLFSPLPYYTDANGLVAMTRHEVTAPFEVGALKIVPYALGEAAYWSDSFTNQSIDRYYGRAGLRASLMFSRIFPYVRSEIFNLNGLAHKMTFDADWGYAQASRSLTEIPQWNEFDDNAQERFRQRLLVNTFGGVLPPQFDPRYYAVRTGAGGGVTDPYHELVDDLHAIRLGWRHRLQTKVGPPERQRIKDWMSLDLGVTVFPDANRDNFGETLGLFTTRYAWNVGDRTTLLASSQFDFYNDAANLWSLGMLSQRSVRGSMYLGYRQIQGGPALDSRILTASYSYQMSPKWISTASTAFDVGEGQNRGQALTITRVGEWLLVHIGFNIDTSKDNVGVVLAIEPKLGNGRVQTPQLGPLLQNY